MKSRTQYVCQSCGTTSPKWLGRCPGCGAWSTLVEERMGGGSGGGVPESRDGSLTRLREEWASATGEKPAKSAEALFVKEGEGPGSKQLRRFKTGIGELDRVLGGGVVPDGFTLLGGDPGIGKSTLLLQMAQGILTNEKDINILYVSGEESVEQIRDRARRLGITGKNGERDRIFLAAETEIERAFQLVKDVKPALLLVDSLQTFSTGFLESAPGSVGQVREVAARLMTLAKSAGISVWLVGHVTKDGNIAGPKVIEHIVDTVLYFEGDGAHSYRLLRTVKNRFGSSQELGVFEMGSEGLIEVKNPSALFLEERSESVPGVAIACAMEGTRPLLVELQALVASSQLSFPRRTSVGVDSARVALLAAILEKHLGLELSTQDLYLNVAGGYRLQETGCDLGACAAIASSVYGRAIPKTTIFLGEVGLTGEVRRIPQIDARADEAVKLGFEELVVPAGAMPRLERIKGAKVRPISRLRDLSLILN